MISEVDINDVSISPDDEIENIESDEDINIDTKIKRSREDSETNDMKGIVLKKFLDENGREYPLTGGMTGYDARVFFDDEDSDEHCNNNCPKDESQTENRWTEKTISQFESNESQKENNKEVSVFTQKQEEEQQLVAPQSPDEFMWFDYGEFRERNFQ
jgi:hypothetical protein